MFLISSFDNFSQFLKATGFEKDPILSDKEFQAIAALCEKVLQPNSVLGLFTLMLKDFLKVITVGTLNT